MRWRLNVNFALLSCAIDIMATVGAFLLAIQLRFLIPFSLTGENINPANEEIPPLVLAIILVVWLFSAITHSVYSPFQKYRPIEELERVILAILSLFLILSGVLYLSYRSVSRMLTVYFVVIDLVLLISWRLVLGHFSRHARHFLKQPSRVLIVGRNEIGRKIAQAITDSAWAGLRLVGCVDDIPGALDEPAPHLGSLADTCQIVQTWAIDEVIITLQFQLYSRLNQIVEDLQTLPVQVHIVPDYSNLMLYCTTISEFHGLPLISLRAPAITARQRVFKRMLDLAGAAAILLFLLPLMLTIAVLIKLDSPGPVFFRQQRVGENGRVFKMYKFRSMVVDAERRYKEVIQHDSEGHIIHKTRDDPRITRVGKVIRRTSLDELPQLINVLKGDMSLVGPRPEMPWLVEQYEPWQRKRFAVPQGITGWWQINGRANRLMHLNTEDDLFYIDNYSLLFDILILIRTIPAVLKGRGAV